MYVCVCNGVTDSQIIDAANNGVQTMEQLSNALDVGTCCGRCTQCAKGILQQNCRMKKNSECDVQFSRVN
jgi:bacterioferritin-associated ferredoxin